MYKSPLPAIWSSWSMRTLFYPCLLVHIPLSHQHPHCYSTEHLSISSSNQLKTPNAHSSVQDHSTFPSFLSSNLHCTNFLTIVPVKTLPEFLCNDTFSLHSALHFYTSCILIKILYSDSYLLFILTSRRSVYLWVCLLCSFR
jgi:hypothetical protein